MEGVRLECGVFLRRERRETFCVMLFFTCELRCVISDENVYSPTARRVTSLNVLNRYSY